MTLRLRDWALQNGFDSFVYQNDQEGDGELTYVALTETQLEETGETYVFAKEDYLERVTPMFSGFLRHNWEMSHRDTQAAVKQTGTFWAGFDPLSFWKKSGSVNQKMEAANL